MDINRVAWSDPRSPDHRSKPDHQSPDQRILGELRKNAEAAQKIRREKQKRDRKRREIKRRKEREAYLMNLSRDFPMAWKSVRKTVERGSGLAYDEACRTLVDMSEAYALHETRKRFQEEMKNFMADHMQRKALILRLVKAGIWKVE